MKQLKRKFDEKDKEMIVDSESEHTDEDEDLVDDLVQIHQKRDIKIGRSSVSAEVYGQFYKKENFIPKVIKKSPSQLKRLNDVTSKSFVFNNLDENELNTVIDAIDERRFNAGEIVISEGENGDLLYIVEKGELDCSKKSLGFLKTYKEGESFGELALLYNAPRAATIQAKTDCILWGLDRETFNHIVKDAAIKKREQYESFLKSISILKDINDYELSQICDAVKTVTYSQGERIITEKEEGDKFFILVEGKAYAEKMINGLMTKVKDYKGGEYFGELALLKNEPRAASVVAESKCKLISLDRRSFKRLLGPIENILKRSADSYVKYVNK
jgi:cAMP-dependent protein kinase regulator